MSEEQKEKKPTWLAKEFPTEWYFTKKFVDKLLHILDKMPHDTLVNFLKTPNLFDTPSGMIRMTILQPMWKLIQTSWPYSELWPQQFPKLCQKS